MSLKTKTELIPKPNVDYKSQISEKFKVIFISSG